MIVFEDESPEVEILEVRKRDRQNGDAVETDSKGMGRKKQKVD